jgi:hypothetical protein
MDYFLKPFMTIIPPPTATPAMARYFIRNHFEVLWQHAGRDRGAVARNFAYPY